MAVFGSRGGFLGGGGSSSGGLPTTGGTINGDLTVTGASALKKLGVSPVTQTIALASDQIAVTSSYVRLDQNTGAGVTLTSTPSIATAGVADGTIITLECVGANSVVLQDITGLAGGKLRLQSGTNKTIGPRDMMQLVYNATADEWRQLVTLAAL